MYCGPFLLNVVKHFLKVKHVGKQLGYPTQGPRVIDLLAMAHSEE